MRSQAGTWNNNERNTLATLHNHDTGLLGPLADITEISP